MRPAALVSCFALSAILASACGCGKVDGKKHPGQPPKPVAVDKEKPAVDVKPAPPEKSPDKPGETPVPATPKVDTPKVDTPAPPAEMPKVLLTEPFRATCVVQTGDRMPPGELAAADGKTVALESLLGPRLTVVLLVSGGDSNEGQALAFTALEDLSVEVHTPFAARGVSVVAVAVGDSEETFKEAAAKVQYPVLADPKSEYFAKVATERLPRVYVLDASGKILWFDLEYSRTTRRDLHRAILAVLEPAA